MEQSEQFAAGQKLHDEENPRLGLKAAEELDDEGVTGLAQRVFLRPRVFRLRVGRLQPLLRYRLDGEQATFGQLDFGVGVVLGLGLGEEDLAEAAFAQRLEQLEIVYVDLFPRRWRRRRGTRPGAGRRRTFRPRFPTINS